MNRWFKDNPVGLGLAASCGVLLAAMLVLAIAAMLPVGGDGDFDGANPEEEALTLPELAESPPVDAFAVIAERPLFSETRQPVPGDGFGGDPLADALADADDNPLDVELSGVVITPTLRMVTLRKKDADRSLVAFEGRPIEGEFSSWQVSRIEAREVVLTSGSGEELQLELKVHDERIEPPQRPAPKPGEQEPAESQADADAVEGEQVTRAEEIRQRIAERREELRREAELQQQAGDENAQPDYQQAIQSMIGRNRANNRNGARDEQ